MRWCFWLLVLVAHAGSVAAQEEGPFLCSGLASVAGVPGAPQKEVGDRASLCPPDHAVMGVSGRASPKRREAKFITIDGGDCCPLPRGILSDEHSWSTDICPEDSVATGNRVRRSDLDLPWELAAHEIRCTKIDTARYALGPNAAGEKYGVLESEIWATVFGLKELHTTRAQLPLSLRYGLGRRSLTSWSVTGCVGVPPGSLLVGKTAPGCSGLLFRSLEYREEVSDGLTPSRVVSLLPECVAVDDIFSAQPKCVKALPKESKR